MFCIGRDRYAGAIALQLAMMMPPPPTPHAVTRQTLCTTPVACSHALACPYFTYSVYVDTALKMLILTPTSSERYIASRAIRLNTGTVKIINAVKF